MTHEFEVGDWLQEGSFRWLVFNVVSDNLHCVERSGMCTVFRASDPRVKHLQGCIGWDWQPPKPIEPPTGYRLLTDEELKAYARKIEPRYRPFENAAEFAPHRDKWVMYKGAVSGRSKVVTYGDGFIKCREEYSFESAFINLQFEDGTPFGVKVDETALWIVSPVGMVGRG